MGMLRFDIAFCWQLGVIVMVDCDFLEINIPFISMSIALRKQAKGVCLFGKYF